MAARFLLAFSFTLVLTGRLWADWPQAAGPHHDYRVAGQAAGSFSVAVGRNVVWKSPLPNTGESTPVVSGNRVFVTCHAPVTSDAEAGSTILGICFDARDGKELWRREIPGTRVTDMASGFSDNTAASPVTDGKHVCFVNVGGAIRTYDFEGKLAWKYDWVPFGRHHARQQEPILHNGNVILLKTVADNLPAKATTKGGAKPLGRDRRYWTRLHAFDLKTGTIRWVAESATSVHSASQWNRLPDGTPGLLTGRGGGHQPPEEPYGLSLLNADNGKTLWDLPISGYTAHENAVWQGRRGYCFVKMKHYQVDMLSGGLLNPVSLTDGVDVTRMVDNRYQREVNTKIPAGKKNRPITYHTNLLVGKYHYFRTFQGHFLGRIHVESGKVEYLQVPVQRVSESGGKKLLWKDARKNEVRNNDGYIVYQDKRATLSGWGHVSAASPVVVGDLLYMPTMIGMVYVLRWNSGQLDADSLVSISDLGPAGKTWSLSSLAFAEGRLFARTQKDLICIGSPNDSE